MYCSIGFFHISKASNQTSILSKYASIYEVRSLNQENNIFRFSWDTFTQMACCSAESRWGTQRYKTLLTRRCLCKILCTDADKISNKSLMSSYVTLDSASISSRTRWIFFSSVTSMGPPDLVSSSNESHPRLNSRNHFVTEHETLLPPNNVFSSSKHWWSYKPRK